MKRLDWLSALTLGVVAACALISIQNLNRNRKAFMMDDSKSNANYVSSKGMDAKGAQQDLDSYYNSIPTESVNAFHEPQLQGKENFGGNEEKRQGHLTSSDATSDLLTYYAKIPTHKVNAFHEPDVASSKKDGGEVHLHGVRFSANKARDEMSNYFYGIPSHNVNVFHEPSQASPKQQGLSSANKIQASTKASFGRSASHIHVTKRGVSAAEAQKEMDSYFMSIPTKNVAADHSVRSAKRTVRNPSRVDIKATVPKAPKAAATIPAVVSATSKSIKGGIGGLVNGPASAQADARADADAPTGRERASRGVSRAAAAARGGVAYDTQYGDVHGVGDALVEQTPAGPVVTSIALKPNHGPAAAEASSPTAAGKPAAAAVGSKAAVASLGAKLALQPEVPWPSFEAPRRGASTPSLAQSPARAGGEPTSLTGRLGRLVGLSLCGAFGVACS